MGNVRRMRSDAGELSLSAVLTGIAVTVVIAAAALVLIVAAGRTSRAMMSQAQTQAKLVDATQRIVQDVRYAGQITHAEDGRLTLAVRGEDTCQFVDWHVDDTGLVHSGRQWDTTIPGTCPAADAAGTAPDGQALDSGKDVSQGPSIPGQLVDPGDPLFQYFTLADERLATPVTDTSRVARVRIRAAAMAVDRGTPMELITSGVPRSALKPAFATRSDAGPDLQAPVLTGARCGTNAIDGKGRDECLSWTKPDGATGFYLMQSAVLSKAPDGSTEMGVAGGLLDAGVAMPYTTSQGVFDPVPGGPRIYRAWRVIAVNGDTGQMATSNQHENDAWAPAYAYGQAQCQAPAPGPNPGPAKSQVTITWEHVNGASGYTIERGPTENGNPAGDPWEALVPQPAVTVVDPVEVRPGISVPGRRAVFEQNPWDTWYYRITVTDATTDVLPIQPAEAAVDGNIRQYTVKVEGCPGAYLQAGCARNLLQPETDTDSPRDIPLVAARDTGWTLSRTAAADSLTPVGDPVATGTGGFIDIGDGREDAGGTGTRAYINVTVPRGGAWHYVLVSTVPADLGGVLRIPFTCHSRPAAPTVAISLRDANGIDSLNAPGSGIPDPRSVNRIVTRFPKVSGADGYRIFLNWQGPNGAAWAPWAGWKDMGTFPDATWPGYATFTDWANGTPAWATRFDVVAYAYNGSPDTNNGENESTTPPNGCPTGCPSQGTNQAGWSAPADPGTRRLHPEWPRLSVSSYPTSSSGTDVAENIVGRMSGHRTPTGGPLGATGSNAYRTVNSAVNWTSVTPADRIYDRNLGFGTKYGFMLRNQCFDDAECVGWANYADVTEEAKTGPGAIPGIPDVSTTDNRCANQLAVTWQAAPGADNYHVFTDAGLVQSWLARTWTCVPLTGGALAGNRGGSDTIFLIPNNSVRQGVPSYVRTVTNQSNPTQGAVAEKNFTANGKNEWIDSWAVHGALAQCIDLLRGGPTGTYTAWSDRGLANMPAKWNGTTGKWAEPFSANEFTALSAMQSRYGEPGGWGSQLATDYLTRDWSQAAGDTATATKVENRRLASDPSFDYNIKRAADDYARNHRLPWRATTISDPGGSVIDQTQHKAFRVDASSEGGNFTTRVSMSQSVWAVVSNSSTGTGGYGVDGDYNVTLDITPIDPSVDVMVRLFITGAPWGGGSLLSDSSTAHVVITGPQNGQAAQRYVKRGLTSVVLTESYRRRPTFP